MFFWAYQSAPGARMVVGLVRLMAGNCNRARRVHFAWINVEHKIGICVIYRRSKEQLRLGELQGSIGSRLQSLAKNGLLLPSQQWGIGFMISLSLKLKLHLKYLSPFPSNRSFTNFFSSLATLARGVHSCGQPGPHRAAEQLEPNDRRSHHSFTRNPICLPMNASSCRPPPSLLSGHNHSILGISVNSADTGSKEPN